VTGKDFSKKIATLGCLCGITSQYWDNFGCRHRTSRETYQDLLSAMGVDWEAPESLAGEISRRRQEPWGSLLEPVQVIAPVPDVSRARLRVWSPTLPPVAQVDIQGELVSESGELLRWEQRLTLPEASEGHEVHDGFRIALHLPLPISLELGYYDLTLAVCSNGRRETGQTRLIAAPSQMYTPDRLEQGQRFWGLNLPLYALKSRGNLGVGDFADLMAIMRWAGPLGAAFVGVNPLHAAGSQANADPSPYSPSSRIFTNILYLSLEMVPEMAACREAQLLLSSPEFQATRTRLADAPQVAYGEVRRLKRRILELLYQTFLKLHGGPDQPHTVRGEEFAGFVAARGMDLERFGQFNALADFLQEGDWRRWPEAYQNPEAPAVAEFAREHREEVRLFHYGQWLAVTQLDQVSQVARDQGLPFTLYEDLALGVNPGGFDTWAHGDLFARGVAIGAPPDGFNPLGQNWGLPPLIPERLRASGYRMFIDTLRANLPVGGMLRMDHAMGLFRLLWIPRGAHAGQGAYVHYPGRDLLAILALESVRRRAVIIGEDLGTVPPPIRRDLGKAGVFSYRVFYFERHDQSQFLPPEDYPSRAMAAVTTHDLPTLAGFWQGDDLALKRQLKLYPDHHLAETDVVTRDQDCRLLLEALRGRKLLPDENSFENRQHCPPELREGVMEYLAQSASGLMEIRLEDIFGVSEQQNLPGTVKKHPNWRLKLPFTVEDMSLAPEPVRVAARLNKHRGR
jgi:4-alpha-glucanotransferase